MAFDPFVHLFTRPAPVPDPGCDAESVDVIGEDGKEKRSRGENLPQEIADGEFWSDHRFNSVIKSPLST